MPNQKKPFYIIGHNPNTVHEAKEFLERGANALEPDIIFDQQFFVSHGDIFAGRVPLNEYLTGLKDLLVEFGFNLALIAFDIKTPESFDINFFLSEVKRDFSDVHVNNIAILVTVSSIDNVVFLNNYNQVFPEIGIGVDECDNPDAVEMSFLFHIPAQKNIAYANGSHFLNGLASTVFQSIQRAKVLRFNGRGRSFKLIYSWVVRPKRLMRAFLNMNIDGILVDLSGVDDLLGVLGESFYSNKYVLAEKGYNPFTVGEPPSYKLTIKTKDIHLAGTDSLIQFTLTNVAGTLSATGRIDGRVDDLLERGSTCELTIEESNIGEIGNLKIEVIASHGFYPEWFPELITLESNLWIEAKRFSYDGFDMDGHPIDVGVRIDHPLIRNPF